MPRLVLLAVAVASLLVAPVAAAPACSGIEEDTTYDDFDIMQTSQSSMEGCCADCDDTPTCTAFTWEQHSTSMNGTCHLKSSSLKQSFRAGSRSAKLVARLEKPLCGTAGDATNTPGNAGGHDVRSEPGHKAAPAAPLVSTSAPTPTSAWTPLPSSTLTPPPAQPTSAPTPVVALPNSTLAATTVTLEPTPPPRQCSNMFYDIDLPGNNLVVLERNTAALCCATCSVTSGCKAFVWMLRGNIGTCMLKSAKGTPTHYPGAIASYPMKPAPVPTPSACPVVEYDVDYRGNDILSTYRSDFRDCCGDCKNTLGCTLYVWIPVGGGKCTLKNKKGAQIISSGARAGVLPHDPPINRTSNVMSGLYAVNSLSPTAFNFISGAQWIDMTTMTAVNAQVEAFEVANRARNFSHASGPVHVPMPESVLNMKVYINVTSSGECAAMTSTRRQNFFTYWNDHMYCYVHMYTRATSLQMVTAADQAIVFPQDSDPAYISTVLTNVNTNADCVKACISKRNCAGVTYAGKTCTFYRPRPSQYPDVVAGWVYDPVSNVDSGGIQYSQTTMSALPARYVKESIPAVASLQACASSAKTKAYTLFGYKANTKVCVMYAPIASATKQLSLVNTPLVPVLLSGTFGSDVVSGAMKASTASDCYKLCVPSQNLCFASVFDSATKTCTYVQPSFDAASTLGWIIPKTLPDTMTTVNQVDFYVTAHQDDHELFMSAPIYYSIKNPLTKSVFVYLSAGDASRTDGW